MEDSPETTPPTTVQKLAAEGIGTLVLVLVGCGSIAFPFYSQLGQAAVEGGDFGGGGPSLSSSVIDTNLVAVALTFGLVLVGLGFAFRRISGGHFNPVVTFSAALAGRLAWVEALAMAAAQLVGGIVGGALLLLLMNGYPGFDSFSFPIGASTWGDKGTGYTWWGAILVEVLLSAILALTYLAATDRRHDRAGLAPLVVGLTFAALYVVSIPAAGGGGVNPVRSIGADLFSGGDALKGIWVFIVGPLIGAAIGGSLYPAVFGRDGEPVAGSGLDVARRKPAPAYGQDQWGQPGAYGQAGYQQAGGHHQAGYPQAAAEQPIIQDGWQWDPQAQQWIPAQQQPPVTGWPDPQSGGQSGGQAGEQTQVRPPESS